MPRHLRGIPVGVVQRELSALMGGTAVPLNFATTPPAVILLAGLQGAGKTTSAGKLARLLREDLKKKVLLVSCDIYRPAAEGKFPALLERTPYGKGAAPATGEADYFVTRGYVVVAQR